MLRFYIAAVVQLVEHPDMDREVAGSSPAIRSDESLKAFAFETFYIATATLHGYFCSCSSIGESSCKLPAGGATITSKDR